MLFKPPAISYLHDDNHRQITANMNAKPNKKKTHYYANSSVLSEEWLDADGRLHREDGPAWIKYHADGSVRSEAWCFDDKLHREDGQAWISYNADGSVLSEAWCFDDKLHRADGPAWISYNADGSVLSEAWYVDGMLLSKEQHIAWHRNQVIDTVLNQDS